MGVVSVEPVVAELVGVVAAVAVVVEGTVVAVADER